MATERTWALMAALLLVAACGGDEAAEGADSTAAAPAVEAGAEAGTPGAAIASAKQAAAASDSQTAAQQAPSGPTAEQQTVKQKVAAREQAEAEKLAAARREMTDSVKVAAADSARADSLRAAAQAKVVREVFAYGGGTRDPFSSVIKQKSAGPELVDLQLVGVLEDPRSPSRNVATFRDKRTQKRYAVRQGDQLGRNRVVQIRDKDVVFSVFDFGVERRETLTLRKQEDVTP